ncbi:MAG: hypothetical protein KGZ91_12220, partial [Afipia sp.]|nr:hypothetical protein [Afipia sp.]
MDIDRRSLKILFTILHAINCAPQDFLEMDCIQNFLLHNRKIEYQYTYRHKACRGWLIWNEIQLVTSLEG